MVVYLPRTAWTVQPRGGATLSGSKLLGCSIHYPASSTPINATNQDAIRNRIRGWYNYHINTRGWSDIGYQAGGDQAGRVWDLRGIDRVPAATASETNSDANHEWGAFLFMIGNTEQPSAALIEAYRDWRTTRWLKRWPHATRIIGHGQVPGAQTECPGSRTRALIASGALARPSTGTIPKEDDDMTPAEVKAAVIDALNTNVPMRSPGVLAWVKRIGSAQSVSHRALLEYVWYGTNASSKEPGAQTKLLVGKLDAIIAAVKAVPGVDVSALAEQLNRIDEQAIADELAQRLAE